MAKHTTVSRCVTVMEQGKHVFEIFDYSKLKGIRDGEFIRSATFSVGGYDWAIRFYPGGYAPHCTDSIAIYLELMNKDTKARAGCDLCLVDQTTGLPKSVQKANLRVFDANDLTGFHPQTGLSINRMQFETSSYLRDDHFIVQCAVAVRKEPRVSGLELLNGIEASPSNISVHLGNMLDSGEGADVTFSVQGETFMAHKAVLAVRSPVFNAEFFGRMREAKEQLVTIEEMQPDVFRALLHFIYTDSLPDMDDQEGDIDNKEMIRHLLAASDRYRVDRLKFICQSILCKNLDVESVSATLALAYQHNCDKLKDICLDFITSSSSVTDSVVATQGYKNLKTTCPSAVVDAFEKIRMIYKA
ncbi:hypothetical protein HU200_056262 [Digitaria exilis]|uniref:Uncharacterized protein n=1 Tax=Digitaria exilis TaxID=1010633 RepID=A0A835AMZ3_9POAL|nr:hypothetical protein HU200_056262 [Digitaria exilis]